jgi:uncharacterized protein
MSARVFLLVVTALGLAACGSSPKTQFFTLSPASAGAPTTATIAQPVTVAAVHVPGTLDRLEMVRPTGTNTVDVDSTDRWTAPLGDMTRRVLSEDLATRLPKDKVVLPDAPAPPRTAEIVVSISEFGPDPKGGSILSGSWSLVKNGGGAPSLSRNFELRGGAAQSAAAQAAVMSNLLAQLAGQIASALPGSL